MALEWSSSADVAWWPRTRGKNENKSREFPRTRLIFSSRPSSQSHSTSCPSRPNNKPLNGRSSAFSSALVELDWRPEVVKQREVKVALESETEREEASRRVFYLFWLEHLWAGGNNGQNDTLTMEIAHN